MILKKQHFIISHGGCGCDIKEVRSSMVKVPNNRGEFINFFIASGQGRLWSRPSSNGGCISSAVGGDLVARIG